MLQSMGSQRVRHVFISHPDEDSTKLKSPTSDTVIESLVSLNLNFRCQARLRGQR